VVEKTFCSQHIFTPLQKHTVRSDSPIIFTTDRLKLGQWMLDQARQAGAVVLTGTPVQRITDKKISTGQGEYGYRFLVGADGSSSLVRRFLGIAAEKTGVGIHCQVPGNFERLEWHLNTDLFRNGYAWIFPHAQSASVGVYASRSSANPKMLLAKLNDWTHKYGIAINKAQPRAALVNYDYRGWQFGNTFLVGDAAGLASGLTGEGINAAIISAEAVAAKILDPHHEDRKLQRLVEKHRRHTQLLELTSKGTWRSRILMECFVAALRFGFVHVTSMEMGVE
jgi:geranylgeranyl reductase